MNNKYLNVPLYFWLMFLVSSLVFIFIPEIDIYISHIFYINGEFILKNNLFTRFLYLSIRPLIIILVLSTIAIFLYNFFKKTSIFNINAKVVLYIILVLSLAPGLIVHSVLKDNWERARPAETTIFGGTKEFSPAFIPTNQNGYSFSSGHAAAAFSLLGFTLLLKKRRKLWITMTLIYASLVSLARVVAGGHFFSDVLTSFFIVYICTYALYDLLIDNKK